MSKFIHKILITGAGGLVGRNISEILADQEYELLLPRHAELELLDYNQVFDYLNTYKPDMVIHCAGKVGGIQANIREPVHFLVDNLEMGKNIIMAAYENEVPYLMNMGSSCMYPRNIPNPLKEHLVLQGGLEPTNEGYALAKITAQRLCAYIRRESPEFMYKTLIPCNLYGKYDKFDLAYAHMIPAAISKIHLAKKEGKNVDIWGAGTARREFMYAGDLADFVAFAITQYDQLPDLINVGIGTDYSINEYYEAIADVIGFTGCFSHDAEKPEGMLQKLVDITSLKTIGWSAKTTLTDGISKTYQYYLELETRK
jgi:GDP-L-fucose synthase